MIGRKPAFVALTILLFPCAQAVAQEQGMDPLPIYETILVREGAPVTIDGNLDDWEKLQLPKAAINTRMVVKNWTQLDRLGLS